MRDLNVLHRKIRPRGVITAKERTPTKANCNQENVRTADGVATTAVAASAEPRQYFKGVARKCGRRLHVKSVAIAFQALSGQRQTAECGEWRASGVATFLPRCVFLNSTKNEQITR